MPSASAGLAVGGRVKAGDASICRAIRRDIGTVGIRNAEWSGVWEIAVWV